MIESHINRFNEYLTVFTFVDDKHWKHRVIFDADPKSWRGFFSAGEPLIHVGPVMDY